MRKTTYVRFGSKITDPHPAAKGPSSVHSGPTSKNPERLFRVVSGRLAIPDIQSARLALLNRCPTLLSRILSQFTVADVSLCC